VHPWYVDRLSDGWEARLEEYLRRDGTAAVGEIGLDNAVDPRNDVRQADVFARQLEIAGRLQRPVSIHCRKAWGSLLSILRGAGGLRFGGAVHSYSGPPDLVGELESLGCCISFSGSILIPGGRRAAESLRIVSRDRLLIETDSPDILPRGASGPNNEPANLPVILYKVAEILGEPSETVASRTFDNAVRVFGGGCP
jgi:TatD DNase family protein